MEITRPLLPAEIESVVALQHGGPVTVAGQQGDHVVMSVKVFRDMMGVGSDDEMATSVAALKESLAQTADGQTMSLDEAAERLTQKYGP